MAQFGENNFGFFGGLSISGSPYGFFYDSVTQSGSPINTAIKVLIRQSQSSTSNVTLSNSQIGVTQGGVYNIYVTFQFENNAGGTHTVNAWFQKGNGVGASAIVDNSNFIWQLTNGQHDVGVLNNTLSLVANDYIECYWSTSNTGLSIVATGTQVSPTRPATPSVTFEINRIS
jgi:hypothetical protein